MLGMTGYQDYREMSQALFQIKTTSFWLSNCNTVLQLAHYPASVEFLLGIEVDRLDSEETVGPHERND